MRLFLRILIPFAVATAVIYAWLGGGSLPPRAPTPDADAPPPPRVEPAAPRPPEPTTGTLVIRVVTKDGKDLPESTRAGYMRAGGADRLRPAGPDGTFRFSDAPVGRVEVVAEAKGYRRSHETLVIVPGIPAEIQVMLTADE